MAAHPARRKPRSSNKSARKTNKRREACCLPWLAVLCDRNPQRKQRPGAVLYLYAWRTHARHHVAAGRHAASWFWCCFAAASA